MNKTIIYSIIGILLLLGIFSIVFCIGLPQQSLLPQSTDRIHSVEAKIVDDTSDYTLYEIKFFGYGSNKGGCDGYGSYDLNFKISTDMMAETDKPLPDFTENLQFGEYSTRDVTIQGLKSVELECSNIPMTRTVEITNPKADCKIEESDGKAKINCDVSATLYPLDSQGNRVGGNFYNLKEGTINLKVAKIGSQVEEPEQQEIPEETQETQEEQSKQEQGLGLFWWIVIGISIIILILLVVLVIVKKK